jgi:hypothetical protein
MKRKKIEYIALGIVFFPILFSICLEPQPLELPEGLTPEGLQAVTRAPDWLQEAFQARLVELGDHQQAFALAVIDAADPTWRDEIAFSITHMDPAMLVAHSYMDELLIENAQLIYELDSYLDYVEVIDYGDPTTDTGYYSTTRYTFEADRQIKTVELARDDYYWWVAMPVVYNEFPGFYQVDSTETQTSPTEGFFWRNWLFHHAKEGYQSLQTLLKDEPLLWKSVHNGMTENGAIGKLSSWIRATMVTDMDSPRSHQPLVIYSNHEGRCGEHMVLVGAISRTALIATRPVIELSFDHTWNQFLDQEWHSWDPAYNRIDDPIGYGDNVKSAFVYMPDGTREYITAFYTDVIDFKITIIYKDGTPIPDAKVFLYTEQDNGAKIPVFSGITNDKGTLSVQLGDDGTFYATVQVGDQQFPPITGFYYKVLTNTSLTESSYEWTFDTQLKPPAE